MGVEGTAMSRLFPPANPFEIGRSLSELCANLWLIAFFFTVGLGGWIVTFMLRVREASPYDAGISGSGFWAGMALGRALLGFVTDRFGERLCISLYLVACIAMELVFWLVPSFVVSAVAVALLGFFLGPMFPGAVIMATKLLPKRIHVSALGFGMAMGGSGGTVFPFVSKLPFSNLLCRHAWICVAANAEECRSSALLPGRGVSKFSTQLHWGYWCCLPLCGSCSRD